MGYWGCHCIVFLLVQAVVLSVSYMRDLHRAGTERFLPCLGAFRGPPPLFAMLLLEAVAARFLSRRCACHMGASYYTWYR